MDEPFEIPVTYQERELLFSARLLAFGFTHKFQVDVFGQDLLFEQDDSGKYRALINPAHLEEAKNLDVNLLQAIAGSIESILK
jgi:hypothetical protein